MRKYAIELIPVKSYKKGLCFTVKDITNHLITKASKGIFTTVNASIYSNASEYSGTMKALRNLSPQ